jgi:hypothetical protein
MVLLLVLLIALFFGARFYQTRPVTLPVVNHSADTLYLRLYGEGLAEPVTIDRLPPAGHIEIVLLPLPTGSLRLASEGAAARIDSELLAHANALRQHPLRLEIGEGNRFTLVRGE